MAAAKNPNMRRMGIIAMTVSFGIVVSITLENTYLR